MDKNLPREAAAMSGAFPPHRKVMINLNRIKENHLTRQIRADEGRKKDMASSGGAFE